MALIESVKKWTRDELILAINLYLQIPFGQIHSRNPKIIALANLLGRTPGSVGYKLANLASIDPSISQKGASHCSKLDKEVWYEFCKDWESIIYEADQILLRINQKQEDSRIKEFVEEIPEGKTINATVKKRVNQNFFRKMILASYNSRCCITGLSMERLLIASHIVPWSQDSKNQLNPQNGLCLNALHDKAFDCGLITLDESYKVVLSKRMASDHSVKFILETEGKVITLPHRFKPEQHFLDYHRNNIFAD